MVFVRVVWVLNLIVLLLWLDWLLMCWIWFGWWCVSVVCVFVVIVYFCERLRYCFCRFAGLLVVLL